MLGLSAFEGFKFGFGFDVLREVTLKIAHAMNVSAVWKLFVGELNRPISIFPSEPDGTRMMATGALKLEVLQAFFVRDNVREVVREVVRKIMFLSDSVEFVNYILL